MAGLHGGFAGKGLTGFPQTIGLKLRPPLDDPLYAIRRYLCLQPIAEVGPLPGPPPLIVDFLPLISGEDLIISEPWEDIPTGTMIFSYIGSGGIVGFGGQGTTSEGDVYAYTGSGGLATFGGSFDPPGPPILSGIMLSNTIFEWNGSAGLVFGGTADILVPTRSFTGSGGMSIDEVEDLIDTPRYSFSGFGFRLSEWWDFDTLTGKLGSILTNENGVALGGGELTFSSNNSSQYLHTPHSSQLLATSHGFSILAKVKITGIDIYGQYSGGHTFQTIAWKGSEAFPEYGLVAVDGFGFYFGNGVNLWQSTFASPQSDSHPAYTGGYGGYHLLNGVEYTMLGWWDPFDNQIHLQVNYGQEGNLGYGGGFGSSGQDLLVGVRSDFASVTYFTGSISQLTIWHRVLTPAERVSLGLFFDP